MSGSGSQKVVAAAFRALAQSRRSVRRFEPNKDIPSHVLKDIYETTLTSPSGFNLQPTQVIMVTCQNVKDELANHAMLGMGNIYRTKDASAIAVFCSDLQSYNGRLQRIQSLEQSNSSRDVNYLAMLPVASTFLTTGNPLASMVADQLSKHQPMPTLESQEVWSCKNTALLIQTYVYAVQSHGLQTCIMEGYDARRVKEILNIPHDRYAVPMVVATGYEYQEDIPSKKTLRLPMEEVFFQNTFGTPINTTTTTTEEDNNKERNNTNNNDTKS